MFKIGEKVKISGLTIGKGNTGNIKQHNFSRGPMTHGSKHKRLQGSLGSGTTPGRTFPGKKMPGRSGMDKRTISGLEIIDIDTTENLLVIKGCIPGKSGNLLQQKQDQKFVVVEENLGDKKEQEEREQDLRVLHYGVEEE
eukprot:gene24585-32018_t